MKIRLLEGAGWSSNCYLVTDDAGRNAVVIDPSVPYLTLVNAGIAPLPKIVAVVLTHSHFDHMLYLTEWRAKTGAPLLVHRLDADGLSNAEKSCFSLFLGEDRTFVAADRLLEEGDEIFVGDECLRVLHTPGHTPGCCCYGCDGFLVTGDTLFAQGGYGRTDLPGGVTSTLVASLRRLLSMDGELVIYPGHGESCRLSDTKEYFHF